MKNQDNTASVAMVASIPELIVSEAEALQIGKTDEERLLKNRKLVLVVDLDQTLIHTTNDNIPANLKGVHHFQLWHGNNLLWYHTKVRPGTDRFLKNISKLFELHICTFGVRMYAHTIARIIDPHGELFSHRILSRDECFNPNSKTANLKALFPCGDGMVAIIDDREDVWNFLPNLIHVKPYLFFEGTADINAPPNLKKNEPAGQKRKSKILKVKKTKDTNKNQSGTKQQESEIQTENIISEKVPGEEPIVEKDKNDAGMQNNAENKPLGSSNEEIQTMVPKISTADKEETGEKGKDQVEETKKEFEESNQKSCDYKGKGETQDIKEEKDSEEQTTVSDEKGDNKGTSCDKSITTKDNDDESEYEELIEWEDEDDYLLYLEDILEKIHTAFYEMITTGKDEMPNVKKIIPYLRKKILKGTNLLFSGVFPTNSHPEKSREYKVAKALGANIQTLFVAPNEDNKSQITTHVVAAKLGTVKVNTALKHKSVHVVTPEWLWTCSNRWERVDERLYYLSGKNSCNSVRDSPDVIKMKKRKRNHKQTSDRESKKLKSDTSSDIQEKESDKTVSGATDNEEDADDEDDDDVDSNSTPLSSPGRKLERQFSDTLNPLISFSTADISNMDKEVEDLLDEPDSDDSDTKTEAKLRKKVLGQNFDESSSEESLSGDFPRGWNLKRKHPHKRMPSEEDEEEEELEALIQGTRNEPHKIFKQDDASSSSANSDFDESIGSVDEEMAAAVEREFLN